MNYVQLVSMPKDTALIYKIINPVNGHSYIGSTVEPKRRWRLHQKDLKDGKHTSMLLQRAWNKYGDKLVFEPVLICSKALRYFYEELVIRQFGDYNLMKETGGPPAGSMAGLKHTDQGKKNLSIGATKRWAKLRKEKYDPLCEQAWELVKNGMDRQDAHKQVGISHSTFWNWIKVNNLNILNKR